MNHTQLTLERRYQIQALLHNGCRQVEIARTLGCSESTVSRELKRNAAGAGYDPDRAQKLAEKRKRGKVPLKFSAERLRIAERLLQEDYSPEQVCAEIKREFGWSISHTRVYQLAHGNAAIKLHLRRQRPYRKLRGPQRDKRGELPDRESISERPPIVDALGRYGDWEVDTVHGAGHQGAILTLVERKSGFMLAAKLDRNTARAVADAVIRLLKPFAKRELAHTITSDNGREFALHRRVARALRIGWYFADPYASHQRGAIENANGLLRQYFPKHLNIRTGVTAQALRRVVEKLNRRPRKRLGMRSPNLALLGIRPNLRVLLTPRARRASSLARRRAQPYAVLAAHTRRQARASARKRA